MTVTFETTVKNSIRDFAMIQAKELKGFVGKRVVVSVYEVIQVSVVK